jgi:hypothetical protein
LWYIFRGYFPKGGGEVRITCHPSKQLNAITMTDRGSIKRVYGRSFVAGVLPIRVKICKLTISKSTFIYGGCRGRDCMVVGFITTYAISAYHH